MKSFNLFQLAVAILPGTMLGALAENAPVGCRKIHTDSDWPSKDVWESALPGVIAANASTDDQPLLDYRLQVKSIEDVQNAVKFAKEYSIRLTVLTTGHDGMARSDAGSGLLIDLSLFNGVKVLESYTATEEGIAFVEPGTEPNVITPKEGIQAAVTFGPARSGQPLINAVADSGLFTVSGGGASVAVGGGFGQNGGYGPITQQYGIGADQWLEALVVTPDGELRVANEVVNSDLFWAIRGGGGGTFGVVVQATWKAYPTIPVTTFNWYLNSTLNASDFETGVTPMSEALAYLMTELPGLQEKGISGSFYVHPTTIRGYTVHPGNQSSIAKANEIWGPILEKLQSFDGILPFQSRPFTYDNYKHFFEETYGYLVLQATTPDERRNRGIVPFDSRLLAEEHVTSPNITEALASTGGNFGLQLVTPGKSQGDGSNVAANPGWRRAVALLIGFKTDTTNVDGLRELAPDMGTYINEASYVEPNWTTSFWGANYPRLSEIKEKFDPNMTFWSTPGINAHYMKIENGRTCIVSPKPDTPPLLPPSNDRQHFANLTTDRDFLFGEQELPGQVYPEPGAEIGLQSA